MKLKLLIFLSLFVHLANPALADKGNNEISFYTGTFDVIDKEGDDQTSLFGIEHKNPNLFRDTFLGKFKPVTGGFVTGRNAIYLYTGVQAEYDFGRLDGVQKKYNHYGKLLSEITFNQGIKEGKSKFYNDNGNLMYILLYKDDVVVEIDKLFREE